MPDFPSDDAPAHPVPAHRAPAHPARAARAAPAAPTEPPPPRLQSVDVFRGLTIAAMVIVNNPGDWSQMYAPLEHAEWNGWTPTDLIFPFFVFILGVSLTLSRRSQSVGAIVKRAGVIYALGFLLAWYRYFDFSTVRLMGVLPRLALCALFGGLIYRQIAKLPREARAQAAILGAAVLLLAYWALLMFVPPPGGVAGDLTPSGNLGAWIDRSVLGVNHLWKTSKTWDPEGLLGTLPAAASALTGVAAGLTLVSDRSKVEKVAILIAAGGASVAVGLVWDARFPINKNLWTSSYVLFTSGLASIALAACYWFIDARGFHRFLHPLVVMGRNPLVLFVFSGWWAKTLLWIKVAGADGKSVSLYTWIYQHAFLPLGLGGPKNTSLAFSLAMLAIFYLPLEVLHRKRLYLRA